MMLRRARRLFFEHLILNLALLLGLAQVGVAHWLAIVSGGDGLGIAGALGLCVLFVAANALAVPAIRTARRRDDWAGTITRAYTLFGVATLLVAVLVAATWVLTLPVSGVLVVLGNPGNGEVFRVASIGVAGYAVLSVAWGLSAGQARVQRTHVEMEVPGLHPSLAGLRLVQISDLHIGNRLDGARLDRMIERTNAADPDLIVITGDIFDFDPDYIDDGARRLGALRARYGVYAVLGNHDIYTGAERVADGLARLAPKVRLLRDELVRVPTPEPLYLAGAEDPGRNWSARAIELDSLPALAEARPDDGPTLLLVHRPEVFPQAVALGFSVVFSGHTHGGQLALPTPGGHFNLARVHTRFTRGLFQQGDTRMYVNRGLGVGGTAMRINCPREIACIELVPTAGKPV